MLAIDIETYSDIDLRKAGLYKYAASPAFGILLIAYAIDDEPVKIIDLMNNEDTTEFEKLLLDPTMLKSAYNAQFEITCLSSWLGAQLDPAQWRCTMVQAATLGLPRSLEDVANTLGLTERKMSEGKALIKYFCQPCNPTAVNGGRTRNYPFHAEDRWNTFKTYCGQDVEVERAVRGAMANYPVIDGEQHAWELDQRINCRGVQADLDLVNAAIDLSAKHSDALRQESQSLSGLDNPNSVAQLKDYLGVDSLTKKDVKAMVEDADGAHRQILENRLELGKTSVSKYIAIQNCILPDSRVRGLFQFYGASRTGRWAGRLVQLQNLPQNHLPDLDMARELVLARDLNGIKTKVSPSINQVLSELVRTAFTAKPGHIFAVADFSAIEARVLAWLADEKWRLDVFATHGRIYEDSAERMFNLPKGSVQKGDPMRQKGKVAELACIAEGSLVLTNQGLVPIEEVDADMLLWDGIEWVPHGGVIYKGTKEVICYDGLIATPDHLVWVEGKRRPIYFGQSAADRRRLVRSGIGGAEVWLGERYKPGKTKTPRRALHGPHLMQRMRAHWMDKSCQSNKREDKGLSGMLTTEAGSCMAEQTVNGGQTQMRGRLQSTVRRLRRSGNQVQFYIGAAGGKVDHEDFSRLNADITAGPDRQQWSLRTGQYKMGSTGDQPEQQTKHRDAIFQSKGMALREGSSLSEVDRGQKPSTYHRGGKECGTDQAKELGRDRSKARVYDIRDAGPRHRFTVSGRLVHNCGYGGSVGALKAMGAVDMGLALDELPGIVTAWRHANPSIVRLWYKVNDAAMAAVKREGYVDLPKGLKATRTGSLLHIALPSGRALRYFRPNLGVNRFGGDAICYQSYDAGLWGRVDTYGAKLVENIVQAIARDCLRDAMMEVEKFWPEIVMHIHDEMVVEVPEEYADIALKQITDIMAKPLPWAPGLQLCGDGYLTKYYKKD